MDDRFKQFVMVGLIVLPALCIVFLNDRLKQRRAARESMLSQQKRQAIRRRRLARRHIYSIFFGFFVLLIFWAYAPGRDTPHNAQANPPPTGRNLLPFIVGGVPLVIFAAIFAVTFIRNYDSGVIRAIKQANAGDPQGAIDDLTRQIELKGRSAARSNGMGCLLMLQRDWGAALSHFNEAERLGLSPHVLRTNRGLALLSAKKPDAALPLLEQAARATPKQISSQCNLCLVLAELGRSADAVRVLNNIEEMRDQQAAILSITPRARHQLDQMIQTCRDRVAQKAKPDAGLLDEL
jgi:tetratricopeptide (TPR) repeat protein